MYRDWLEGLYAAHGRLTPEIVKEAARPDESPGHGFVFNVPPDEAAESYYTERAHTLIQVVRIRIDARPDEAARSVRLFHAVINDEGEPTYEPLVRLQREPDLYAQAHAAALNRVQQAETAVRDLEAAAGSAETYERAGRALEHLRDARSALTPPVPVGPRP